MLVATGSDRLPTDHVGMAEILTPYQSRSTLSAADEDVLRIDRCNILGDEPASRSGHPRVCGAFGAPSA
jgi:hypothetical protein